jgi:Holliday junction DNA helicase RuvA
MIAYLEGKLKTKDADRIILVVNQVGYEILLPLFVMDSYQTKNVGDDTALFIYFHQTERQPKPTLIGFNNEYEKDFFQHFISVEAIGPLKAVKALNVPVDQIAHAIETGDCAKLSQLKGIGKRTAQKIIASLRGKMQKFAQTDTENQHQNLFNQEFSNQIFNVMVHQLGHKPMDAKIMIAAALKRDPNISTAEALFEEVYRRDGLS